MIAAPWAAGSGAIDLYVSYRYRFLPFMAHNKCKHRWFMLCGTCSFRRSRCLFGVLLGPRIALLACSYPRRAICR